MTDNTEGQAGADATPEIAEHVQIKTPPKPSWSKTAAGWCKVTQKDVNTPPVAVTVTEVELRAFEKAHHGELRGVSGPARLELVLAARESTQAG